MRPYLHPVGALVLFVLVCGLALARRGSAPVSAPGPSSPDLVAAPVVSRPVKIQLEAAHREQADLRVRQISKHELKRQRLVTAARDTVQNRRFINLTRSEAWESVIKTNEATFVALQRLAAQTPDGETPCTICDGFWYLRYCVICEHNGGLCVTCRGIGTRAEGAFCPTCLGTGKCHGCDGRGRMPCPFCDDGMVLARPMKTNRQLPE